MDGNYVVGAFLFGAVFIFAKPFARLTLKAQPFNFPDGTERITVWITRIIGAAGVCFALFAAVSEGPS